MSEIERYLDELFDQLAGTSAAGRRALMEAEYHLRAVAADAIARGLLEDQAEHEAVSRFGPPALVARALRSAGRLNRAVSTAWLLAGLAACGFGMLVTRITTATTIAAAGAALLFGRWLAVRGAALTSARRGFALRSRR